MKIYLARIVSFLAVELLLKSCLLSCYIGIALREHDVLAVARLRGMQLTKFEVAEECITAFNQGESEFEEDFAMSFETFCEEVC